MSLQEAKESDAESLHAPFETRQRIIQRNKKRIAIRLEEAYWAQLEACAKEQGRKLSDVVFEAIGTAGKATNRAANLRVYCLQWILKRLAHARQSAVTIAAAPNLQTILSACPSPCVIMTKDKAIIAYNPAFSEDIVSRLTPSKEGSGKPQPLTFRLDTPLEKIHAELLAGKARYKSATAGFACQGAVIQVHARFCLLSGDNAENSPLLCYLLQA